MKKLRFYDFIEFPAKTQFRPHGCTGRFGRHTQLCMFCSLLAQIHFYVRKYFEYRLKNKFIKILNMFDHTKQKKRKNASLLTLCNVCNSHPIFISLVYPYHSFCQFETDHFLSKVLTILPFNSLGTFEFIITFCFLLFSTKVMEILA